MSRWWPGHPFSHNRLKKKLSPKRLTTTSYFLHKVLIVRGKELTCPGDLRKQIYVPSYSSEIRKEPGNIRAGSLTLIVSEDHKRWIGDEITQHVVQAWRHHLREQSLHENLHVHFLQSWSMERSDPTKKITEKRNLKLPKILNHCHKTNG
jgi:hypothetical protein